MHAEVLFVAGYAATLLAASAGLHRLGRVNTSPWRGRVLAGHRRALGEHGRGQHPTRSDWPHSEVPHLHTGIALVAVVAAILLAVAELARHHRPPEVLLLGTVAATAAATATLLTGRLRAPRTSKSVRQ